MAVDEVRVETKQDRSAEDADGVYQRVWCSRASRFGIRFEDSREEVRGFEEVDETVDVVGAGRNISGVKHRFRRCLALSKGT